MKDISQYPTPETDFLCERIGDPPHTMNPRTHLCRDLERRLTACREFIQNAIDYSHIQETDKQSAEDLLAATAPKS